MASKAQSALCCTLGLCYLHGVMHASKTVPPQCHVGCTVDVVQKAERLYTSFPSSCGAKHSSVLLSTYLVLSGY